MRIDRKRFTAVTVFAVAMPLALSAAAASAAPEFGRCTKVAAGTGAFATRNCTSEGGERRYAWQPGVARRGFTGAGGEATLDTSKFGLTLKCTSETSTGEYSGTTTVTNVVIALHGCEEVFPAGPCSTTGAADGEVVSHPLSGTLGVTRRSPEGPAKNRIGLMLSSADGIFAEYNCPPAFPNVLRGSVIGPVLANVMSSSPMRNFKSTGSRQSPERFEGGPRASLESSIEREPFEPVALRLQSRQSNEERLEVNSVF